MTLRGPIRIVVEGTPPRADERFDALCMPEPTTGCTLWLGSAASHGYGQFYPTTTSDPVLAHVYAWEREHGPLPPGHEIDHVRTRGCSTKLCVGVDHLEAVTHAENMRRSGPATKTHCVHGHELRGDNLYRSPKTGRRQCRTCRADAKRRSYAGRFA